MKRVVPFFLLTFIVAFTEGCMSTAAFQRNAYGQTLQLREETLALIARATEPYQSSEQEVSILLQKMNTAFDALSLRAKKQPFIAKWQKMSGENIDLVEGFFERWKSENRLSEFVVGEAQTIVAKSYDAIADLQRPATR